LTVTDTPLFRNTATAYSSSFLVVFGCGAAGAV
jgi:hypothetical protein